MVAVWPVASKAAILVGMGAPGGVFLAPVCGGFIGGVGLVLCAATCHGRLFTRKYIFRGAAVGSFSAQAFGPWSSLYDSNLNSPPYNRDPTLLFAFAVWQAAVGTYLYAIVHDTGNEARPEDSQG